MFIFGLFALFRMSFFYNETENANILEGKALEFNEEDLQLAFTIDGIKGERFPSKDNGLIGKIVNCSKGATASWNNETWGLENINSNGNKKINCTIDFVTKQVTNLYEKVNVGEFVSYTPEKTNYEITSDLTGYTSNQTINPSELNLWRVIRKNSDGSIELVSEYTSSTSIYFKGKEGYKNYIGTLNTIASQYETNGITSGSRYMGYNGQTENITNETLNKTSAPWTESTTARNSLKGSTREAQGGGDLLYETDTDLVKAACGTLKAYVVNATTLADDYYLASRNFVYNSRDDWVFCIRRVYTGGSGSVAGTVLLGYINYDPYENDNDSFLRPIVTLKAEIQLLSGDGSQNNPYKIN